MDDDRIRHVAREGLRPMLGETPPGPSWEELNARRPKRTQAWLAGGVTALIVLTGVAALPLLLGQQSGPTTTVSAPDSTTAAPSTTAATTSTSAITTSTVPGTGLPLETPLPLRVLSANTERDALDVIDLQLGTTTNHEDLLPDVAGAVYNSHRELMIWNSEAVHVFGPDLVEAENEFAPSQPPPTGSMWVVPATDGDTAWVVQPGADNGPTYLELRNIESGERLIVAETDAGLTPVGTTDDGLVFNTGDNQVVLFTYSGATLPVGNGRAIATSNTSVIFLVCSGDLPADCEELWFGRTNETDIFQITKPDPGIWIPFETMLPVISPDGTKLLIGFGLPSTTVHVVDLVDGGVQPVAPYVPGMHAAWSSDGNWIALINGTDIDLINAADPAQVVPLRGVIPQGFVPIAAG
jgi:hypothetical protein